MSRQYQEGVDFKYLDVDYSKGNGMTGINLLFEGYEGVIFTYGKVKAIEEFDTGTLRFGYTIISPGEHDMDSLNNSKEFCIIMGEILQQILLDEIDNGTPRENDTEKLNLQ